MFQVLLSKGSSTSHLAKVCTLPVKCSECSSTHHNAAMHPSPFLQNVKASSLPQEDGGEGEERMVVSISCTDICTSCQWSCSCSKICLTNIYPKGAWDKAIKAYMILDDQSKRSLARLELFELFGIKSVPCAYYLRTYSGVMATYGRKAEGYQIESMEVVVCLPSLLKCNEILNNRSEIPTPSC